MPAETKRRVADAIDDVEYTFDSRDAAYAWLRAIVLAGCAAWALISLEAGPTRDGVVAILGVFVPYCGLMYLAGSRILRSSAKDTFYLVSGLSDTVFLSLLIRTSGGVSSPFLAA